MMRKRILSALLVLVLLLGVLAGCSKKDTQTTDDANKNDQSSETAETRERACSKSLYSGRMTTLSGSQ